MKLGELLPLPWFLAHYDPTYGPDGKAPDEDASATIQSVDEEDAPFIKITAPGRDRKDNTLLHIEVADFIVRTVNKMHDKPEELL